MSPPQKQVPAHLVNLWIGFKRGRVLFVLDVSSKEIIRSKFQANIIYRFDAFGFIKHYPFIFDERFCVAVLAGKNFRDDIVGACQLMSRDLMSLYFS